MRTAGFQNFKMAFVKAKYETGTDTLHVNIKHVPENFDFSVPLVYWIKISEEEFTAHKADFGRLAPDLFKECNLKPCKHPLTLKCLCHLATAPRKPQGRNPTAPNSQSDQMDFLRAQIFLQQQEESEEEAAEEPVGASAGTSMVLA